MFKTNFSGHSKIWGHKKLGGTALNARSWLRACTAMLS